MQQALYIYSPWGVNRADSRSGITKPTDLLVQDALAATQTQPPVKRIQ
jgi:hypothetical protein